MAAFATFIAISSASAQQSPTVRIRGTIESVDGNTLGIKTREGTDVKVKHDRQRRGLRRGEDLTVGDQGRLLYRRHRHAPARRHAEGDRGAHLPGEPARRGRRFSPLGCARQLDHDQRDRGADGEGTDGQNITVKYKDGEKKVVVPPDTPIVTFVASDKSEIKPGAKLIIFGAAKKEDGTLEANRVNVGRDGITPPM